MDLKNLKKILFKEIKKNSNIYVMGHNNLDLDCLAAMIGIGLISEKLNRKIYYIIDDQKFSSSIAKALENIKLSFIRYDEVKKSKKNLLIVVDTNKKSLISIKDLSIFSDVIVIDHHNMGIDSIDNCYCYIDSNTSSTSEIITELIRMFNVKLNKYYATIILSGIVLDTNNFVLRVSPRTFYNVHYLVNRDASLIEVQYLLKQDIKEFILRQKMLSNVVIIDKKIALASGANNIMYRREDLAKIAETLLQFNEIESSFVIGRLSKNEVGISGRTLGNLNVGELMSRYNGGGNDFEGATVINDKSIKTVKENLIKILKTEEDYR